jgi:ATP-binding cassette subfamily F protein 3
VTILSLSDIRVEFGATTLLRDVTFTVAAGECWGIVGRNGAGKTTLFRLLSGAMQPTSGAIARAPGLRFALLDQYRDFGDAATVWEAAAQGYREVLALEQRIADQAQRLAELGSGITALIGGFWAIGVSWLDSDLSGVWCRPPRRLR